MTSFTNRGRAIYKQVVDFEQRIFFDKNAGKVLDSIEFRLKTLRNEFESQAKSLVQKMPSNMRSSQNVVNRRNNVKKVKVSEMNSALNRLKTLSKNSSVNEKTALLSELRTSLEEVKSKAANTGKALGV
jgi:hypothetical protein